MFVKEFNKLKIDKNAQLKIALVYPNRYQAGMSSYTIHLLYYILNKIEGIACERFFLPEKTTLPFYKNKNEKEKFKHIDRKFMISYDSGESLTEFDIIAFSIHYELDYFNVLWILDSIGLPFNTRDRMDEQFDYPLIIAGGPVFRANPLVMLDFFDIIVVNDFEPVYKEMIELFIKNQEILYNFNYNLNNYIKASNSNKSSVLFFNRLLKIPNVLVSYISKKYIINRTNLTDLHNIFPIERAMLEDFKIDEFPHSQISVDFKNPKNKLIFGDTFLIEINRGCPYNCRFCLTGYLCKPYRNRSFEQLKTIIDNAINEHNIQKLTMIGSSIADHPHFKELCIYLISKNLQFTIPSIRLDRIDEEILDYLKSGGLKSITIAPEAGSDSLRRKLSKNIKNKQIIEKCKLIFAYGFESIKFYFLIGLPYENDEDIKSIVNLMQNIRKNIDVKLKYNALNLNINYNIPKLMTPFGNFTINYITKELKELKRKSKFLEENLKDISNLVYSIMDVKEARIQTILSQMDESFGDFLHNLYLEGAKPIKIDIIDRKMKGNLTSLLMNSYECFTKNINSSQENKINSIINYNFNTNYLKEK